MDSTGSLTGVTPAKRIWVEKTEEKSSDVNITSHLVRDACFKRFDVAVLITNDSDLAEPVRIVREEFELPIGVLNPHEHHSVQLKKLATFLKRIRQSHLVASQFSADFEDAKGRVSQAGELVGGSGSASQLSRKMVERYQ